MYTCFSTKCLVIDDYFENMNKSLNCWISTNCYAASIITGAFVYKKKLQKNYRLKMLQSERLICRANDFAWIWSKKDLDFLGKYLLVRSCGDCTIMGCNKSHKIQNHIGIPFCMCKMQFASWQLQIDRIFRQIVDCNWNHDSQIKMLNNISCEFYWFVFMSN